MEPGVTPIAAYGLPRLAGSSVPPTFSVSADVGSAQRRTKLSAKPLAVDDNLLGMIKGTALTVLDRVPLGSQRCEKLGFLGRGREKLGGDVRSLRTNCPL